MGTLLHGIACSENIDSSGEVLILKGVDTTSLHTFNFEHKSEHANQTVGRILSSKKIYSEQDCETEAHLKFWNRFKVPYLYIIGELFDDVGHSGAIDVAAIARYDEKHLGEYDFSKTFPLLGASIEGSKINKEQNNITHSLARKISLTFSPCNKTSWLEIYHQPEEQDQKPVVKKETKSKTKELLESILKSEDISFEQTDMLKTEIDRLDDLVKAEELLKNDDWSKTKSGKSISLKWNPEGHAGFNSQDHRDAMNAHYNAALATPDKSMQAHHMDMTQKHLNMANKKERWSSKRATTPKPAIGIPNPAPVQQQSKPVPYVSPQIKDKKYAEVAGGGIPANKKLAASEDLKKVHATTSVSGVSDMGIEVRRSDKNKKHGFARTTTHEQHGERAKQAAKLSLETTKKQPKPNLPKSEKSIWNSKNAMVKYELKKALTATASPLSPEILDTKMKDLTKSERSIPVDVSVPTWNLVDKFRQFISEKMPNLSEKEANAFTRAFKVFKIKQAEKNLKDM